MSIGRLDNTVMHPLPIAARRDDAGAAEITEMPRYLRLASAEDSNEEAHANLIIPHEIDEPQPRSIGERLEKPLTIEPSPGSLARSLPFFIHNSEILAQEYKYVLTYVFSRRIL